MLTGVTKHKRIWLQRPGLMHHMRNARYERDLERPHQTGAGRICQLYPDLANSIFVKSALKNFSCVALLRI